MDFEERKKLVHTLRYGLIFIFFQNSKESVRWVGYLFPPPLSKNSEHSLDDFLRVTLKANYEFEATFSHLRMATHLY